MPPLREGLTGEAICTPMDQPAPKASHTRLITLVSRPGHDRRYSRLHVIHNELAGSLDTRLSRAWSPRCGVSRQLDWYRQGSV